MHNRSSNDDIPVAILLSPDKLSDRYCRIIKEKFAGFNKEFEDIVKTQRSYSIPGKATTLRSSSNIKVCPGQGLVLVDSDSVGFESITF